MCFLVLSEMSEHLHSQVPAVAQICLLIGLKFPSSKFMS